MSVNLIAENTRLALAQSLAILERHRDGVTASMQKRLVAMETSDEAFGQGDITALVLVRLLLGAAGDLVEGREVGDLREEAAEHRRLEIDGRHYSRFGLALGGVLRETLGPRLSPAMVSAWTDAYWFVVRELAPVETGPARLSRFG
ncbi:globin domain-containing protein [Sphingosinicella terrae]|uniref:globin domain-containing protein n=1 Tax=Sphingosinicella terrae TaxID=2172047 RepID=UPI000E0D2C53|nr:globin domain-containing protein [Sphingosinicella terrae]